jgi:prephenate dehydrogenase
MARWNREALLEGLSQYRQALSQLERQVESQEWSALQASLEDCQRLRPEFL